MSEEKTKNYYDGIAKGYRELYHEEQIQKISLVSHLLPTCGRVLDLGSGDGVLNQFLENCEITSLDLSKELLALNSNPNKVQGSATEIPFEDNSFNYVLSFSMLQDIENYEKAIEEIKRVLKPNGKAILSFIKFSQKKERIIAKLKKKFEIKEEIEEEKDLIFLLHKSLSLKK